MTDPDGKSETVLSVAHDDRRWQLGYAVASPIQIPKGAKLRVCAHYDNSSNNPFNPDATEDVFGGNQTW